MNKPTIQEIQEYAKHLDYELDAEGFFDYYEAIGWVYGTGKNRKPIADWKASVRLWKRRDAKRQKATQAAAVGEKVVRQRPFKPTVFVQCVKGPTTGRYLPIILRDSHLKEIPNEQYVAAAEEMCRKLSQVDRTEWIVRADVDERQLMKERAAASSAEFRAKRTKRGPLGINKEVYNQVKEIRAQAEDGQRGTDAHTKEVEDDCPL